MQTYSENCVAFPNRIKLAIIKLKKELMLSSFDMANLLEISFDEYSKHEKADFASLSIFDLDRLAEALMINVDDLINLKVDLKALSKQMYGNINSIPEKYQTALFSSAQTLQNFIRFTSYYCGHEVAQELVKSLQIKNINALAPYEKISIQLIEDTQHFLAKRISKEYWQEMFFNMGQQNFHGYKQLGWGPQFATSIKDAGIALLEHHLNYIDNTWDYTIVKAHSDAITFDITTKECAQNELRTKSFGSIYSELQKEGFAYAYLQSVGINGKISKIRSLADEDSKTRFVISC